MLLLVAAALAGCASDPEPFPDPVFEEYTPPHGDFFADSRHCYAYNVHRFMLATDLVGLVPASWSFVNPLAPEVRVLLHRCIEDFAVFLTVPMRAGGPGDLTAPLVDFVVEAYTNTTEDDWAQMGAPVHAATIVNEPLAGGEETWRVTADGGWALRIDILSKAVEPGPNHVEMRQYGGGPDLVRSWASEQAALTRAAHATVAFGPSSVLRDARDVPVTYPTALAEASPNHWWGAFNAEYRLGPAP
ncbi:MAG: hypothetical protein QOJ26_102 [Thermoplasmata archaeon]|nr:hypothetical protein [Thermoplasmata archaeon]